MTSRDAVAFIEATASDDQLQAEWENAGSPEALVGIAAQHGYTVDASELEAALAALQRRQQGELSDADLEQVSGGTLTKSSTTISTTTLTTAPTTTLTAPKLSPSKLEFFEAWPAKWKG